ncbi:universal stress protein [Pseudomonas fluorescens]|uniref:Universal stress protein n=1 Tax=Pseudomonas fluorescens TaxID=294 RepID=A0AAE2PUD5_PSEFL|nr:MULTISPECIES: universal stress protein [Pseudomonas fluorescens group]MBA1427299.1 universal stress protein [Pseudomonas orientalis]MBD8146631.1 universal stress protein [Pseudomonas fluorescens]MBD8175075.1 universal stress protein [Pseudomonas fluorescens]MBD8268435.1 universal stress protein [Pseudomonas fluorescens]MBD8743531.1 universal stress protein [Pseudomonas fluorescens]
MPYTHILVAVDLTEECDPVIKRAQESSIANGAKLSLVHIVEPMAMAFGGDVPMDLSQLQQQQFDQAKERLERLILKYPKLNKEACHLTYGQPRQEIHHLAKEHDCDLIVVGSHGRHGLALLLGSTANDVLHGAPCDVLAVKLVKDTSK